MTTRSLNVSSPYITSFTLFSYCIIAPPSAVTLSLEVQQEHEARCARILYCLHRVKEGKIKFPNTGVTKFSLIMQCHWGFAPGFRSCLRKLMLESIMKKHFINRNLNALCCCTQCVEMCQGMGADPKLRLRQRRAIGSLITSILV